MIAGGVGTTSLDGGDPNLSPGISGGGGMCPGGTDNQVNQCLAPIKFGYPLDNFTVNNVVNNGFSQPGDFQSFAFTNSSGGTGTFEQSINSEGHPTLSITTNGVTVGMCVRVDVVEEIPRIISIQSMPTP